MVVQETSLVQHMVKQPLPRSALIGSPVSGHVSAENKTVFSQSDKGKSFPSLAKKTQLNISDITGPLN